MFEISFPGISVSKAQNWSQNTVFWQAFLTDDERRWDSIILQRQRYVVWQEESQCQFNLWWKKIQQEIQEWQQEVRASLM